MSAVYLAAPYGAREKVREFAKSLRARGHVCTSSWLEETHEINGGTQGAATSLPDETVADHARTDMSDINRSDALVLFTAKCVGVEGGGGRHVETGLALGLGLLVLVVGEPENVFHRLGWPHVIIVPDWSTALEVLSA